MVWLDDRYKQTLVTLPHCLLSLFVFFFLCNWILWLFCILDCILPLYYPWSIELPKIGEELARKKKQCVHGCRALIYYLRRRRRQLKSCKAVAASFLVTFLFSFTFSLVSAVEKSSHTLSRSAIADLNTFLPLFGNTSNAKRQSSMAESIRELPFYWSIREQQ